MGSLQSELLRAGVHRVVEVSEAQGEAIWRDHLEGMQRFEEKAWELKLGDELRKHPHRDVSSIIASMPPPSWGRAG